MRKMTVLSLPYYHTRATVYQALSQMPGFVLLESSDPTRGDYDILAAYPYDTVETSPTDEAIAVLHGKLDPVADDCDLPFVGGAIGYVSYEWGAALQGVDCQALTIPLMRLQFYDWAIISLHRTETMVLVARHQRGETAGIVEDVKGMLGRVLMCHPREGGEPSLASYNANAEMGPRLRGDDKGRGDDGARGDDKGRGDDTVYVHPTMAFDAYTDAFHAIKHYLQRGRCYQVNLTQRFNTACTDDAWSLYERLRVKNPVPFGAFMRLSEDAAIVSCSPERLLLHDKGQLLTSPIKGTIKRSADEAEDKLLQYQLQSSEKDRAENIMIVDLLRNDLGKVAQTGTVEVTALCELQSFKTVHHLVSHIQAQLRPNLTPLDAFLAAFPGGSITGAPKKEAMKVIAELETTPRGIYCGSMVYFSSHGRMDSSIAIRTLLCQQQTLTLAAGGGIVIDSELLSEYEECYLKIKAIVDGLHA